MSPSTGWKVVPGPISESEETAAYIQMCIQGIDANDGNLW